MTAEPAAGRPSVARSPQAERRRAAVLAGHTGDADAARALLDDPDASVRGAALGALDRLGTLTVDQVRGACADPAPAVRRRGAELLITRTGEDAAAALLGLLDDDDPTVVEAAAWAAGERPDARPATVRRLEALATDHDDPLCREAAVAALGSLGEPGSLPVVLAALDDRATVRRRAVVALAAFDDPQVDAALEAATHDRDRQVRQAAEDLLGR